MKLYIATPINARQEQTIREKLVAAKRRVEMLKEILADDVRFKNYDLISTFDFNDMNDTEEKEMSRCIYHVLTSDAIYLDLGWTMSKGCNLEYLTAKIYGKQIFEHSEYLTKETMNPEENKRMLALSYIVADLKAENMELEQRLHQLENDYNDVVRQLDGKEKRNGKDSSKQTIDEIQQMREHCDHPERLNKKLERFAKAMHEFVIDKNLYMKKDNECPYRPGCIHVGSSRCFGCNSCLSVIKGHGVICEKRLAEANVSILSL